MFKYVIIVIVLISTLSCMKEYTEPDKEKGLLKPQFRQSDVNLQESLVETLRKKCNQTKEQIFCDQYRLEHKRLQDFYYDAD